MDSLFGSVKISAAEYRNLCENNSKLQTIQEILESESGAYGDYRILRKVAGLPEERECKEE